MMVRSDMYSVGLMATWNILARSCWSNLAPTNSESDYDHCVSYSRDYGETDCDARYMETPYDYWETEEDDDIEYKYLLGLDGVWYCWNILFDCKDYVKPLSEALDELGCCS